MGLFSSSYKYEAYAGSQSLFEEDPKTMVKGLIEASIANMSLSTSMQFSMATDLAARAKDMIKYASKPDGYIRGLPTSNQKSITIPSEVLLPEIEKDVGEPLEDLYWMIIGRPDEGFHVAKHLQAVYDNSAYFPWDFPPDNPVWSEERQFIEIPVINPDTGKYYIVDNLPSYDRDGIAGYSYDELQDMPPEEYALLPIDRISDEPYKISFAYTDNNNQPAVWTMNGSLDLSGLDGDWIQGRYTKVSEPDTTYYYNYLIGSNENAAIEASIVKNESLSSFMPVAIMMQDKVWYDGDYDYSLPIGSRPEKTPLHATTDKLLKSFSMKGRKVKEEFLEQEADASNEDNGAEKWDFFIHCAVPIQSGYRASREYLYEFFLEMEKNQQYSFEEYQNYLSTPKPGNKEGYYTPQPVSELIITEGSINGYNVKYGWSYIYSETFDGRYVKPDGQELKYKEMFADGVQRTKSNVGYTTYLEQLHGPGILVGKWNDPDNDKARDDANGYHDYYMVVRQHYDEDTDTWSYTQLIVMGLSMVYTINTREEDIGKNGYRFRYADMGMFNFNDDGERTEEFRIPIHIGILERIPRVHREQLISDSMCATVFLVQKIKVKWYQKSFWKWLIVIIAIVLIVLSFIYGPLPALAAEALLGVAAGAAYFMIIVILSFAMGMVFALASQTIAEEFGQTAGTVFAIIAAISQMGIGHGGLSAPPGSTAFGSAAHMITTTASFANMGLQVYSTYALAEMEAELRDFMMDAREKYEEIADAWDQLGGTESAIDPLDLKRAFEIGQSEAPQSYYSRTLNANPGLLGYDLINNFAEIALDLPDQLGSMSIVDAQISNFKAQRGMV
jgi:hypothetical protein